MRSFKRRRRALTAERKQDKPYVEKTGTEPDAFTSYVNRELKNSAPISAEEEFGLFMKMRDTRIKIISVFLFSQRVQEEIHNYLKKRARGKKEKVKELILPAIEALECLKEGNGLLDIHGKVAEMISDLGIGYEEIVRWHDLFASGTNFKDKSESGEEKTSLLIHGVQELTAIRDDLIRVNLRLVVSVARAFSDKVKMPIADRVQEGNIGLMVAIDKFDPQRGWRFSTYASQIIWQRIIDPLRRSGNLLHIPGGDIQQLGSLDNAVFTLWKELQREPTIEEVAEKIGMDHYKLLWLQGAMEIKRLDWRVGEKEKNSFGDYLVNPETRSLFDAMQAAERRVKIEYALEQATQRGKRILQLRLMGECTLTETADILSNEFDWGGAEIGTSHGGYKLTRERIRVLQNEAIDLVRPHLSPDLI